MVKTIEFKLELTGHGVVQTAGNEKSLTWLRSDVDSQRHDNVVYAKGNFVPDGIPEPGGRQRYRKILKISGDGLRHAIHALAMPAHTPNILLAQSSRFHFLANKDALLRGWLIAAPGISSRKKSCYAVSAAEDKNAVLAIELFSNSGPKETKSADEGSDVSLFARETTGDTCYSATGFIDISELRFISVSDVYGRRAIDDDSAELYRRLLSQSLGSEVDVPRYWRRRNGSSDVPEYGIKLNNAQVHDLIKYLLSNMAGVNITKSASGFARTSKITIKNVGAVIDDLTKSHTVYFDGETVNETVLPVIYDDLWTEVVKEDALRELAQVSSELDAIKTAAKEKTAEKKAAAKAKKTPSTEGA